MNIVHCGLCYTLLQLNESSVLQVNPHGSILEPWHNKPWTGKWSRKWGALYMTEIIRHLWNISWTIGMLFKLFYYGTICIKRCKPSSGWSDFISTQFTVYSQLLNTHKQNLGRASACSTSKKCYYTAEGQSAYVAIGYNGPVKADSHHQSYAGALPLILGIWSV